MQRFFNANLFNANLAHAQQAESLGYIVVENARIDATSEGWLLSANADIRLPPEIHRGLDSGVPLEFIVEFKVRKHRKFWPDATLLTYQRRYSLIYYVLTRHYRLESINNADNKTLTNNREELVDEKQEKSRNFRSVSSALEALGLIEDLPVDWLSNSGADQFEPDDATYGQLTIQLDERALPLPLQSLFSSEWKLASEDYAWSLN